PSTWAVATRTEAGGSSAVTAQPRCRKGSAFAGGDGFWKLGYSKKNNNDPQMAELCVCVSSWRWITLVLLAWGTLLFYIGGHLVRDSERPERSSRELSKILAKLERLKQQNEDLRRMAESLRVDPTLVEVRCSPLSPNEDGRNDAGTQRQSSGRAAAEQRQSSGTIPEGQAEAAGGSLAAAGRLRSLEDQLTRAKQKIQSFSQRLVGDGYSDPGGEETTPRGYSDPGGEETTPRGYSDPGGEETTPRGYSDPGGEETTPRGYSDPGGEETTPRGYSDPGGEETTPRGYSDPGGEETTPRGYSDPGGEETTPRGYSDPGGEETTPRGYSDPGGEETTPRGYSDPGGEETTPRGYSDPGGEETTPRGYSDPGGEETTPRGYSDPGERRRHPEGTVTPGRGDDTQRVQ
ncbi:hypothetical protein NHX12_025658, partial [Muraenolepis orangiensis]